MTLRTLVTRFRNWDDLTVLFLIWALLAGTIVRIFPVLSGEFPVNDGGLFYLMTQEIQQSHYTLPLHTTYNLEKIPFAYPPLSFYLIAIAADLSHVSLLQLYRWLPPLTSILTIPCMYLLSKLLMGSRLQASLATIAFAMLPRSYAWLIMGGGFPRSLGGIFSLLTLCCVYLTITKPRKRWVVCSILFMALLFLSHPEWAFHTVFSIGIFWLFVSRSVKTALKIVGIGIASMVLTAPWWLIVLYRHGLSPFLSAIQTGGSNWLSWWPLFVFNFAEESYVGIISVLAIIGLLICLFKQKWFLPVWLVLPFIIEARNAPAVVSVPLAILASIGLSEVLIPGLLFFEKRESSKKLLANVKLQLNDQEWLQAFRRSKLLRGFLTFFMIYSLLNAISYSTDLSLLKLTEEDANALQWVAENTPPDSHFIITGVGAHFDMPVHEWFPALTHRANLGVVQGYEWIDGPYFPYRVYYFARIQKCSWSNIQCVEDWAEDIEADYDFIWVHQQVYYNSECLLDYYRAECVDKGIGALLTYSLENSVDYSLVYNSSTIKIFERLPDQQTHKEN